MGPWKDNDSSKVKRKNTNIMIDVKKEIIAKHENGVRVSDLATQFGMAKSTICTIPKNRETIKKANVARGVTVITKQKAIVEEISSEEGREDVPTSLIREICAKWGEVQSFVERYQPDKVVASRSINIFNDNAMCHFRNILKRRQKQITMDNFLVRQRPCGSEAESSGAKRQKKRKRIPFQTITFHFLTTFHLCHQLSFVQVR